MAKEACVNVKLSDTKIFEDLCEVANAIVSWRDDCLIPEYENTDWKCPYVKRIMDAIEVLYPLEQ